jgi:hypothetical protein
MSPRLWQFPTDSFNISDECWFQKKPIGKDTLVSFMFTLSKQTGLSQIYTNHSIRATGATINYIKLAEIAYFNFLVVESTQSLISKLIISYFTL